MPLYLKNISIIGLSLLIALCSAEGLLRLINYPSIQDEAYFFGFYGTPPYFQKIKINDRYFYQTNPKKDIQANTFPVVKSDSTFRVFVLGGSVAYGEAFGASGSFAYWMQKRLEAYYPERKFEIINCARKGFGSCRVKNIFDEIIGYDPDLIILFLGNNEARDDRFHRNEINIEIRPRLKKIKHVLDHSYLFRRLFQLVIKKRIISFGQEVLDTIMKPDVFDPEIFTPQIEHVNSIRSILDVQYGGLWISKLDTSDIPHRDRMQPFLQQLNRADQWHPKFKRIFLLNINHMIDQCQEKHVPLLFLGRVRNFYYNRDARLLFDYYDDTNQILKSLSQKRNIPLVNLLSVFSSLNSEEIGYNYFLDSIHLNLLGNQIIAKAAVSTFIQMNLLDQIPPSHLQALEKSVDLNETKARANYTYNSSYFASIGWQKLICLNKASSRKQAEEDIVRIASKAIELDPKDMEACMLLGTFDVMYGNIQMAEQVWKNMKTNFNP